MASTANLSSKDIADGKSISDLFSTLSEESKNQCLIYIMALRDKEMLINSNKHKGSQQESA